jgi:D-apiose dehydrogenase
MLKGVCVGAGYFSRYQYKAWNRIPEVSIVALCNRSEAKGIIIANDFQIPAVYTSLSDMLDKEQPDFIDIITPPETHLEFCREAFRRKVACNCTKTFGSNFGRSRIDCAGSCKIRCKVNGT